MTSISHRALDVLRQLHSEIDDRCGLLAAELGERLSCGRGCADCCVDDIRVLEVEAARIIDEYPGVLADGPAPPGGCAFLGPERECRIYDARPYVCRTQGLPLRWFEDRPGAHPVELRDICPLNDEGEPIEEMDPDRCWLLGPTEARLAALQAASGDAGARVALRELFEG